MRLLWLREPWASAVEHLGKTIECRSWSTTYRGPVVICSSKAKPRRGDWNGLPVGELGVARCLVQLVGCEPLRAEHGPLAIPAESGLTVAERRALALDWGGYGLRLELVRSLPRVALRGRLGLVRPQPTELTMLGL